MNDEPPHHEASPFAPFATFWQAGYEGADHVNHGGRALNMNGVTGHIDQARSDYALLHQFGIRTVRESAGWRLCERDGVFDFSVLDSRLRAAQEYGLQICWTFCHYGWPEELDVYGPDFVPRFARYCRELAAFLAPWAGPEPVYSPINEISFQSWGLSVHMFRCKNMHDPRAATEGKRQLVRASIAGIDAIRQVTPGARFLQCDPMINVIAPPDRPDWIGQAAGWRASQFDAWDMLCGRRAPELGGAPRYLDLIGGNYYHDNQWENGTNLRLWWHLDDARRLPLHRALLELHQRYGRPLLLAETSHVGSGRGIWIRQVAEQAALAIQHGADVRGVCLYPTIDRPDWDHADHWHRSGLWEVNLRSTPPLARLPVPVYATALHQAQRLTDRLCRPIKTTNDPQGHRESAMKTMIVFCHLRWDFVFQRPQQLMSRLAQHYRIVFVEEPVHHEGKSFMRSYTPAPNVTVYQPHTPVQAPGFHDDQLPLLKTLLADLPDIGAAPIAWFYTPMALPLLPTQAGLVVYDCMDELSAFKNPPKQLLQRETALLKIADLVFTGGPSLYEAKRSRHDNAHCFASSVDAIHFHQALDRSNGHPLHNDIPHPRLGYYGVIDERFDAGLIAAMADAHPEWQLVLVGPIVKIDPATLPQRQNIHYLGQHSYQVLPQFLAGWDVCLLPFALNESTRYISPTKVLEYMAAELPAVSTAIADVERPYGDIVAIGHDHDEFIAACEAALAMDGAQRTEQARRMREVVERTSWEATAEQMHKLLQSTPPGGRGQALQPSGAGAGDPAPAPMPGGASVNPLPAQSKPARSGCVIIGGGPTGLSAAYHLGPDTVLLEKNATVGGWCRSIQDHGFTFDYAGHIMFSNDPYVLKLYDILLGDNQHWQMREAWVYSKQVYTRYPFQGALYGLPPAVIKECILGAIESRYGLAGGAPRCDSEAVNDCCADGTADVANSTSSVSSNSSGKAENRSGGQAAPAQTENFEGFIYRVWGAGIARHFAIPYNKKIWTVPLKEMETSWLGGRVPLPDLAQIIEGALEPVAKPMGPNARFGYPRKGGFQALVSGFLPHIRGKVELNSNVVRVLPQEHTVVLADGRRLPYSQLISTMPLPELVRLVGDAAPEAVRAAANGLRHVSIRCVNIGIGRTDVTDKHWIYYPEDSIFHRIFVQGNASPECNAPGGFGFTCEISYSPWKPLPLDGEALIARCIEDCIKVGIMREDDTVLVANQVDMPYAYVVYDHARAANVATVRSWMEQHDIVLAGRYSEWEYYNSDHAFLAGKKAAERITANAKSGARKAES
jgi:protoporphyrinogen oxidase/glycosyltransferase involved in cell wall biosynthesis